jgi:RNA polymerase sigma-70 factor (ECF subfamily)
VRDRRLHRLFERFRKKGDVAALGKAFDAVAPELYRVAVHLARDLHTAEDLVQSTFLAAIESRERWDASRPLVPWLLGILVRKAAHEQRSSARTPEHERLAPRSANEPVRESEARETLEMLQKLLASTSSPYREVLVMHLCEEKSAAEIARDLGRAPGTVRVQIHRGLEMLRKNMPAGLVATGALAAFAPRGLAAVRGSVMSAAHVAAAPVAVSAASVSTIVLAGGLAMKAASISVAVVGAALCALWFGLRSSQPRSLDVPVHAETSSGQSRRADASESALVTTPSSPARELAPAGVADAPRASPTHASPPVETSASDSGLLAVCGRLVRPDGQPATDAFVALLRDIGHAPDGQPVDSGKSADNGAFCLHARPGSYFLVALSNDQKPWTRSLTIGSQPLSLEAVTLSSGEAIAGHVRLLRAPAPAQCELAVVCRVDGKPIALGGKSLLWVQGKLLLWHSSPIKTDAQGGYSCSGLERELYRVSLESAPPSRVLHASIETEAPNASADLDVDLARLVVHVQRAGEPAKASVALTDSRTDATGRARQSEDVWGTSANPDAEFLIPPGGDYRVEASGEGTEVAACTFSVSSPGETIERTLELKPRADLGELQVELFTREAHGFGRSGFGLFSTSSRESPSPSRMVGWMFRPGPSGRSPDIVRDAKAIDGVFHLRELPAGGYDVVAMPESTWRNADGYWRHDPVHVDITAGGVARARVELHAAGRLRLRCDDRRGVHLPALCEVHDAAGSKLEISLFRSVSGSIWTGGTTLNVSAPDGANDVYPNLPEGTYAVHFSLEGFVEATRTAQVKPGVTTEVDAVLEDR